MPPGKIGEPIKLSTNLFGVSVKTPMPVFQYDVTISGFLPNNKEIFFAKKSPQE